jgi:hypothetical protein
VLDGAFGESGSVLHKVKQPRSKGAEVVDNIGDFVWTGIEMPISD